MAHVLMLVYVEEQRMISLVDDPWVAVAIKLNFKQSLGSPCQYPLIGVFGHCLPFPSNGEQRPPLNTTKFPLDDLHMCEYSQRNREK